MLLLLQWWLSHFHYILQYMLHSKVPVIINTIVSWTSSTVISTDTIVHSWWEGTHNLCLITLYTNCSVSPVLCLYDEGCGDLSVLRGTGESYGSGGRGDGTDIDLKWVCQITNFN